MSQFPPTPALNPLPSGFHLPPPRTPRTAEGLNQHHHSTITLSFWPHTAWIHQPSLPLRCLPCWLSECSGFLRLPSCPFSAPFLLLLPFRPHLLKSRALGSVPGSLVLSICLPPWLTFKMVSLSPPPRRGQPGLCPELQAQHPPCSSAAPLAFPLHPVPVSSPDTCTLTCFTHNLHRSSEGKLHSPHGPGQNPGCHPEIPLSDSCLSHPT